MEKIVVIFIYLIEFLKFYFILLENLDIPAELHDEFLIKLAHVIFFV